MIGKLNEIEIDNLLRESLIGRIACHADGVTYIVPLSYAYDGIAIYAYTQEGRKIDMMRKNPSVCFEIDDTTDMSHWKSVIAWGRFEELTDNEARTQALNLLNNRVLPLNSSETTHLGQNWPFSGNDLSELPGIVFRIQFTEKTGRFENSDNAAQF